MHSERFFYAKIYNTNWNDWTKDDRKDWFHYRNVFQNYSISNANANGKHVLTKWRVDLNF